MILKENIYIEPFKLHRTLHIYLPDDIQPDERFPVIYMFDGILITTHGIIHLLHRCKNRSIELIDCFSRRS